MTNAQARAIEAAVKLPITKFYDMPNPLPPGAPGALIRSEEFGGYVFPDEEHVVDDVGLHAVRILYHSRSAGGADVAASGVVLVPYGKPPAGGWPVIAWAHGTSGVARQCAPSLMKDLYYNWEGLLEYAMMGYAVVATDYAGLGTRSPHEYMSSQAQASDVLYSIPAARKAVPSIGARWVAVGHSEGGAAVLHLAEMQHEIKDPNYLGTLALAPATDLGAAFDHINTSLYRGYMGFLAYGAKAVYPRFRYSDVFTPLALKYMAVAEKDCWYATLAEFANGVPIGKMMRPNWQNNKYLLEFSARNKIGTKPAYGEITIMQGLTDESVPAVTTEKAYKRMLALGDDVTYKPYPGLDHDPLMFGSFADQVAWLRARFTAAP